MSKQIRRESFMPAMDFGHGEHDIARLAVNTTPQNGAITSDPNASQTNIVVGANVVFGQRTLDTQNNGSTLCGGFLNAKNAVPVVDNVHLNEQLPHQAALEAVANLEGDIASFAYPLGAIENTAVASKQTNVVTGSDDNTPFDHSNVKITLIDESLWQKFHGLMNEMIVTKDGRRIFPVFKIKVEGLNPAIMYTVNMDFSITDLHRWKFMNGRWIRGNKEDNTKNSSIYMHCDSPNFGSFWMSNIISFSKLKISNKISRDPTKIQIHSLFRYMPRIHIYSICSATKQLTHIITKRFDCTEFIAVTAYQNDSITRLKVSYNPFAKAFLDSKRSNNSSSSLSAHSLSRDLYKPYNNKTLEKITMERMGGSYKDMSKMRNHENNTDSPLSSLASGTSGLYGYQTETISCDTVDVLHNNGNNDSQRGSASSLHHYDCFPITSDSNRCSVDNRLGMGNLAFCENSVQNSFPYQYPYQYNCPPPLAVGYYYDKHYAQPTDDPSCFCPPNGTIVNNSHPNFSQFYANPVVDISDYKVFANNNASSSAQNNPPLLNEVSNVQTLNDTGSTSQPVINENSSSSSTSPSLADDADPNSYSAKDKSVEP